MHLLILTLEHFRKYCTVSIPQKTAQKYLASGIEAPTEGPNENSTWLALLCRAAPSGLLLSGLVQAGGPRVP